MKRKTGGGINRREFLHRASVMTGAALAGPLLGDRAVAQTATAIGPVQSTVHLSVAADDGVAASPPVVWAVGQLRSALTARGVQSTLNAAPSAIPGDVNIIACGADSASWRAYATDVSKQIANVPDAMAIASLGTAGQKSILAAGHDARGLVYALGSLTERVRSQTDPVAALRSVAAKAGQPRNRIRSVLRMFVSDVEDKAWFHDRDFWHRYLTMLIEERFNRFNLSLGLGYDRPDGVRDTYFYFAYPFLVNVRGYNVRARGLSDEERDKNLASLRFISDEAAARGLHFQLGIWTHAYQWTNSPSANYVIDGVTAATQGPYCRDALHMLLEACPNISGVTFRVHGESGVPEGSYDLWKMIFDGIVRTGRKIEIDMHAKGMDQPMIDTAMGTGLPVMLSPKFWAEHMGLPYHQASIREQEMPRGQASGAFALSSGTRSFLRYGYGDLLTEDRNYGILHRIWPGTQRLLLWGDRKYAAEYGRIFNFLGSDGVEIFDPLSFKGREGSGLPGDRGAYAEASLKPAGGNWEKYRLTYRLWGRMTYDPDADLGSPADPIESALGQASRILPLITTAHSPAAANFNFWPEMYTNMSLFDAAHPGSYGETTAPKIFGNVSSLDPQLFASVIEYVTSVLSGKPSGKITPLEVAAQLERWSDGATADLAKAKGAAAPLPAERRMIVDAAIAGGIGKFFAWKLRAGVLWTLFDSTGHEPARTAAAAAYEKARAAWADLSDQAKGVYVSDITFGPAAQLRGHWADRLAAIDADITGLRSRPSRGSAGATGPNDPGKWLAMVNGPTGRPALKVNHTPAASFTRGKDLPSACDGDATVSAAKLWYRHANQAERWVSLDMPRGAEGGTGYSAAIAGKFMQTTFAIQYYFELFGRDSAAIYPGFAADFLGQPYYLVVAAAK